MHKVLLILLLVLMTTLTACDDGSSPKPSETIAEAVDVMGPIVMNATWAAYSSAYSSTATGSSLTLKEETSRSTLGLSITPISSEVTGYDGLSVSGTITLDEDSGELSGALSIHFDNYVKTAVEKETLDEMTFNGTFEYAFSGSNSTTSNITSGIISGPLTVQYKGESYSMIMDISYNKKTASIRATGTITCNGVDYIVDVLFS